ncbi:MAG: hydrogenase maturation protease [Spirochaetota bacterium]
MKKILLYGYGNPGRQDDALGIILSQRIESRNLPGVTCEQNYQLNIEDALTVSEYDIVIFTDASHCDSPFVFRKIDPAPSITFTTHSMSAESVISLCEELYGRKPLAYMLEICGREWETAMPLSSDAESNLQKALDFLYPILENRDFEALNTGFDPVIN